MNKRNGARHVLDRIAKFGVIAAIVVFVGRGMPTANGEEREVERDAPRSVTRGMPVQFRPVSQSSGETERIAETVERKSARANSTPPLPLTPSKRTNGGEREALSGASPLRGSFTTFGSLCLIVGAGATIVWLLRRPASSLRGKLPPEVIETLGTTSLNPRLEVHLLRVGGKLILVGSSPSALETLLEIDDADEVARLTAACQAARGLSVGASVREALSRLEREPHAAPATNGSRPRRFSTGGADA